MESRSILNLASLEVSSGLLSNDPGFNKQALLGRESAWLKMQLIAGFLGQVTNGWNEEEKEQWVMELSNALPEEKASASLETIAWIAVAQK